MRKRILLAHSSGDPGAGVSTCSASGEAVRMAQFVIESRKGKQAWTETKHKEKMEERNQSDL